MSHHHHPHSPTSAARILTAFLLNLFFSVFELIGGILTGSVAILSDALHDLGDAAGIGLSFFLERKSRKQPDTTHTYGYARYSVLGSLITTVILLLGSVAVIGRGVDRILHPVPVDHKGMILFALVGVLTNGLAAYMTREGDSLNRKAVNLEVVQIRPEDNAILVKGSIPGARNGVVIIRKSLKNNRIAYKAQKGAK